MSDSFYCDTEAVHKAATFAQAAGDKLAAESAGLSGPSEAANGALSGFTVAAALGSVTQQWTQNLAELGKHAGTLSSNMRHSASSYRGLDERLGDAIGNIADNLTPKPTLTEGRGQLPN